MEMMLFAAIGVPIAAGLLIWLLPKAGYAREVGFVAGAGANLALALMLYGKDFAVTLPWTGFGMEFSLRVYQFSAFIVAAAAFLGFLVCLYSAVSMKGKTHSAQLYSYLLISLGVMNGAVFADNLVLMLFFWEGLLISLFGMIVIGRPGAFKTALKFFVIVGISDLCLMAGIGLTAVLAGTLHMSEISLPMDALGSVAFILLMIGAIAKAGSMPFHTWIPDAAEDAPLPFMALVPASLEKLLGIYFLTRISLDLFQLKPDSGISILLMTIGAVTILLAVMMALIQKNYKRLLAYHAVSQVGYMILGIGTCLPVGIIGGLFHMVNNALYKNCLFLTGGAVERQTGTSNLADLGGLRSKMPITFACFAIAALSISGMWPFNGFFSKELVYDAALERNVIFYLAAVIGSFFTAASFLKLGHSAFFGKLNESHRDVKEVPWLMLGPMIVIAGFCIFFGVFQSFPINHFLKPVLEGRARGEGAFSGFIANWPLIGITVLVLAGAFFEHCWAAKKTGSGLHAADPICQSPILSGVYEKAKNRFFDPYDIGLKFVSGVSKVLWWVDRAIDWLYDGLTVGVTRFFSAAVSAAHTGSHVFYMVWVFVGAGAVVWFIVK